MVISIVCFHRSNTSMAARLLARSGVHLGPEEDLLARRAGHPLDAEARRGARARGELHQPRRRLFVAVSRRQEAAELLPD